MFGLSPYLLLGGVAAMLATSTGAYFYGDSHGADRVIAREAIADAKATAAAVSLAQERQQHKDDADTAQVERARLYALIRAPIDREVTKYVETPAAHSVCITGDGRLLADKAIDAANAALARPTGTSVAGVRPAS